MPSRKISELNDATSLLNTDYIPVSRGNFTLKLLGASLIRLNEFGNVGIGQNTPTAKLHVVGSTFLDGALTIGRQDDLTEGGSVKLNKAFDNSTFWTIKSKGSGTAPVLSFQKETQELVQIDPNGNMGIGITPTARLHVKNNSTSQDDGIVVSSGRGAYLKIDSGETNTSNIFFTEAGVTTTGRIHLNNEENYLGFDVQNAECMRISNFNIGIGTTSPTNKLTVSRSSGASSTGEIKGGDGTQWSLINSNALVNSWNPLTEEGDHQYIFSNGTVDTGSLVIGQWSTTSKGIRINSNGLVGIGIDPTHTLTVQGDTKVNGNLYVNNGNLYVNGDGYITTYEDDIVVRPEAFQHFVVQNNLGQTRFTVDTDSGNVGIGVVNPTFKLDVNGNSRYNGNMFITGTVTISGAINGGVLATKNIVTQASMGTYVTREEKLPNGNTMVTYYGNFSTTTGSPTYTMNLPVTLNLVSVLATAGPTDIGSTAPVIADYFVNGSGLTSSIVWRRTAEYPFSYQIIGIIP